MTVNHPDPQHPSKTVCGEDGSDGEGTIVCSIAPHDPATTRHEMHHESGGITWWFTVPQQWRCGACGYDYTARRPRCPMPGCHKVREQELVQAGLAPAPAVRARPCPLCGTPAGEPCTVRPCGFHLARWLDAYTAGKLTRAYLARTLSELVVIDPASTVVPAPRGAL